MQFAYLSPLTGLTMVVEPTQECPYPTAFAETRIAAVGLHQADGNPIGSVTVVFGEEGEEWWVPASGPILCSREALDAWGRAPEPLMTVMLSDGLPGSPHVERCIAIPEAMVLQLRAGIASLGGDLDPDAVLAEHSSHDSDESRLAAGQLWLLYIEEQQPRAE
ncbi:hypothetical protein K2O51_30845 (plasmid) [Cupriavidus pinatubonensis]|uniref:hypothetical protein n=1 Tax=Cupriavidus pinatubonensis TaxID=248026 RepID=UPI001C734488|nr:hypothetical protein [Cupriavidus pinatubonensis]QYY33648.1 hypothetical protein K2O51_30845 [Cupriavidus pinatubonensis]